MSLAETEASSARFATAPRAALAMMEEKIVEKHFCIASDAIEAQKNNSDREHPLQRMTLCFLVMENGFVIVGKTAPASAANFRTELGEKFAYEDAIRQLWPLEGYLLRERLSVRGA